MQKDTVRIIFFSHLFLRFNSADGLQAAASTATIYGACIACLFFFSIFYYFFARRNERVRLGGGLALMRRGIVLSPIRSGRSNNSCRHEERLS